MSIASHLPLFSLLVLALPVWDVNNDFNSLADDRVYWWKSGGDVKSSKRDGTDTKKETTGQKVKHCVLRGADYIIASGYVL